MTHISSGHVLFVFAHQDDEYAAAPWIAAELELGQRVRCVYFTDGASRCPAHVRDEESLAVLGQMGIAPCDVVFLGSEHRIPDGALVHHLESALAYFGKWMTSIGNPLRIYMPDWEGGHPDHDAAHVIVMTHAAEHPGPELWSFSIYNAYRCPRPFFKSLSPLPWRRMRKIAHAVRSGLRFAMLCWRYPSQRRTWLGLFPGAFYQRAVRRKEYIAVCEPLRLLNRPHEGELLYERMFGIDYERFESLVRPYVKRLSDSAEQTITLQKYCQD